MLRQMYVHEEIAAQPQAKYSLIHFYSMSRKFMLTLSCQGPL